MRFRRATLARALALVIVAAVCAGRASATIGYTVSLAEPENHLFHVTMTIPDVHSQVLVQMPAWNALYQIRDFSSRIEGLGATSSTGSPPTVLKLDKQTWRITGEGIINVAYRIYWDDAGPFSSQLSSVHAFMNLAEILMYIPDRRKEPVWLVLRGAPSHWVFKTALKPYDYSFWSGPPDRIVDGKPILPRVFVAQSYDELVDAPVEGGSLQFFDLPGVAPPVHVVVHGEKWSKPELQDGLVKIVNYETQLMGGAPYSNYTFLLHIGADSSGGGGGMEHANCTAIGAPNVGVALSTAAHEFFHLWNVKRIRPQSLEPVDYTKEMYTRALWFAEGVTSTYASYTEVRTGMWSADAFWEDLAEQIGDLQSRPARAWESVEESSLNAWFEKYSQYNRADVSISYYNKGQIDGVLLDLLIRDATDNKKSLDDVMRAMNEQFAKKGKFYDDSADIEAVAESVAGVSFKDFFAKYVAGTDEIPYDQFLAIAGMYTTVSSQDGTHLRYQILQMGKTSDKQRRIREGILKGTTN